LLIGNKGFFDRGGMIKRTVISILTIVFICSIALADSIRGTDNGYKWNRTSEIARINLCKDISRKFPQHDWKFYYDELDGLYSINEHWALSQRIADVSLRLLDEQDAVTQATPSQSRE